MLPSQGVPTDPDGPSGGFGEAPPPASELRLIEEYPIMMAFSRLSIREIRTALDECLDGVCSEVVLSIRIQMSTQERHRGKIETSRNIILFHPQAFDLLRNNPSYTEQLTRQRIYLKPFRLNVSQVPQSYETWDLFIPFPQHNQRPCQYYRDLLVGQFDAFVKAGLLAKNDYHLLTCRYSRMSEKIRPICRVQLSPDLDRTAIQLVRLLIHDSPWEPHEDLDQIILAKCFWALPRYPRAPGPRTTQLMFNIKKKDDPKPKPPKPKPPKPPCQPPSDDGWIKVERKKRR